MASPFDNIDHRLLLRALVGWIRRFQRSGPLKALTSQHCSAVCRNREGTAATRPRLREFDRRDARVTVFAAFGRGSRVVVRRCASQGWHPVRRLPPVHRRTQPRLKTRSDDPSTCRSRLKSSCTILLIRCSPPHALTNPFIFYEMFTVRLCEMQGADRDRALRGH